MEKKIYYHDTDCGGVVYYANYLKYLEEGRTEYFAEKGIDLSDSVKKGTVFAVSRVEADYKKPAQYGDTIDVITAVEKVGNCSIDFAQEIKRGGALLFRAKVVLVCVTKDLKPQRLPEEIRTAL